ncbi:MAG: hypothetical protein KBT31_01800 [Firmicutes bacterium]|nr:hypothetical protein [Candidatus Colimorpha enterica]
MEKPKYKIIIFDEPDIITTSGEDNPDEDKLAMIWLSPESVFNYNNMYEEDMDLKADWAEEDSWSAFDGAYWTTKNPRKWNVATGQDDTPESGIYTVRENNVEDYQAVLGWLTKHNGQ